MSKEKQTTAAQPKQGKPVLLTTVITIGFWLLGNLTNVYQYALVGAIYEILWFPFLILAFVLPILSLVFWYKSGFAINSNYFISLVLGILLLVSILFLRPY